MRRKIVDPRKASNPDPRVHTMLVDGKRLYRRWSPRRRLYLGAPMTENEFRRAELHRQLDAALDATLFSEYSTECDLTDVGWWQGDVHIPQGTLVSVMAENDEEERRLQLLQRVGADFLTGAALAFAAYVEAGGDPTKAPGMICKDGKFILIAPPEEKPSR